MVLRRSAMVPFLACVVILCTTGCTTTSIRRELSAEYFNLGNAYFELKKYDKALALYEKSLRYDSSFSEGSYNLARVYIIQERYAEGIAILRDLMLRDGDNLLLSQTLAFALAKSGKNDEAEEVYRAILSRSEGNIGALYNLSILAEANKNRDKAYDLLKTAYELSPEDPDVLRRLGLLEADLGKASMAIQYLERYREKKAEDIDTAFFLSGLYKRERFYAKALDLIDALIKKKKDDPKLWFEQAFLYLVRANEKEAGLESFGKALELGYSNKAKLKELLSESQPAYIGDVKSLILKKKLLTEAEIEEAVTPGDFYNP